IIYNVFITEEKETKVKTSVVRLKSQPMHKLEKCCLGSCSNDDPEEEPPGKRSISDDLEEEPPSKRSISHVLEEKPPGKVTTTRYRFFGDIPDDVWDDWKWQFRNRITRVEQLTQFIPLSTEEQAQLRFVT